MEPKSPLPRFETQSPAAPERAPLEAPTVTPEFGQRVEQGAERVEQRADAAMAAASAQTAVLPVPVPLPAAPQDESASVQPAFPSAAADDDLIEKEWVDKAKQIIEQTRDDPFRREQEVTKLQAEYLRKRYGRELGASQ